MCSAALAVTVLPAQDGSRDEALSALSSAYGVDAERLQAFFDAVVERTDPPSVGDALGCLVPLADDPASRDRALQCLSATGLPVADARFFETLMAKRRETARRAVSPSGAPPCGDLLRPEPARTLELLTWLTSLARAGRETAAPGKGATDARGSAAEQSRVGDGEWFVAGQGFLAGEPGRFPFEDGDVVLALGGKSISAVVARSTLVARDVSHAAIVRRREGRLTAIETLPESGAVEVPLSRLAKRGYFRWRVLRWADEASRAGVARAASDQAFAMASRRAPFDLAMDGENDEALYCTEIVLNAYHAAAREARAASEGSPEDFVPALSSARSAAMEQYLQRLGVSARRYVSPGDLEGASRFTVVAEWESAASAASAQRLTLLGDLFAERIEAGEEPRSRWYVRAAIPPARVLNALSRGAGWLLGQDWGFIPRGMSGERLGMFAAQELSVFPPVLRRAEAAMEGRPGEPPCLRRVPPWAMRDVLVEEMSPPHRVARLWRRGEAAEVIASSRAAACAESAPVAERVHE